jgi:hypothetical protein
MKKITFGFLLSFISLTLSAQIHFTRADLFKHYGTNYTMKYNSDRYLYNYAYVFEDSTKASGKYKYLFILSFPEDNDQSLCVCWARIEPVTEANNQVNWVRSKDLVQLEAMKWNDFTNNCLYSIDVDEYCITTVETPYEFKINH